MSNQPLIEALKKNHLLIDVRTPNEFATGTANGAINIPLSVLHLRLNEIPQDVIVIVFCQSGGRSAVATKTLQSNGYTTVVNGGSVNDVQLAQAAL